MIRYLNAQDVYFSLNDVSSWLYRQGVLTKSQSHIFSADCKKYVSDRLSNAYEQKRVYHHLEPVIFPYNDYFIHWIVWANLLTLLPESTGRHRKVHYLNMLVGDPDAAYKESNSSLLRSVDLLWKQAVYS